MSSMARIEAVLFLREVDLFQFCDAHEVLRIASIARERRFAPGDRIFSVNDSSDALYCVVEGKVRSEAPGQATRVIEPGGTFGVLGILSGRLRLTNATAEEETLTLAIEAEDFFDLLSNNIEIVKALFRLLTPTSLDQPLRSVLR